jgi:hypothetical protein
VAIHLYESTGFKPEHKLTYYAYNLR